MPRQRIRELATEASKQAQRAAELERALVPAQERLTPLQAALDRAEALHANLQDRRAPRKRGLVSGRCSGNRRAALDRAEAPHPNLQDRRALWQRRAGIRGF